MTSARRTLILGPVFLALVVLIASGRGAEAVSATGVSAGGNHTCAVTQDGAAMCWGNNDYGELGVGELNGPEICGGGLSDEYPCVTTPTQVAGLASGVDMIAAGDNHTCAVLDSGGVTCWGRNMFGQLGNGDATGPETCTTFFGSGGCSSAPVVVPGLDNVQAVTAGSDHTCALTLSGGVKCWGDNYSGELGTGSNTGPEECSGTACSTAPVDVVGLTSGVESIAAGGGSTCALLTGGAVKCWGSNSNGKLGDGTTVDRHAPAPVTGLGSGVAAVEVGGRHSCVLIDADRAVKCWGGNSAGALGVGSSDGPEECYGTNDCATTPREVSGLNSVSPQVTVEALSEINGEHTCAMLSDGDIKCWGANNFGMLGLPHNGPETCSNGLKCSDSPVSMIEPPEDVAAITAGGGHTCSVSGDGAVKCWGYRFYGALGNGESGGGTVEDTYKYLPVDAIGLDGVTPTPTDPPGPEVAQGDVDCDEDVDSVDALKQLRHVASLSVSQGPGCVPIGQTVSAIMGGSGGAFGDVDCDGDVDAVDALKVLRHVASLPVSQEEPCTDVGEPL